MFWRRLLLLDLQWRDPDEEIYDVGWNRNPPKIKLSTYGIIGGTITVLGIMLILAIFGIYSRYDPRLGFVVSLLCLGVLFLFLGFWILLLGVLEVQR